MSSKAATQQPMAMPNHLAQAMHSAAATDCWGHPQRTTNCRMLASRHALRMPISLAKRASPRCPAAPLLLLSTCWGGGSGMTGS